MPPGGGLRGCIVGAGFLEAEEFGAQSVIRSTAMPPLRLVRGHPA